jgi:hypothetical protein
MPLLFLLLAHADWFARAWQSDEGLPNSTVTHERSISSMTLEFYI